MKLALLSDIHANIQALDACLAHARAHGAARFALLGDLGGYGADPVAVLDRVVALVADGALVIKGNHDELAVSPPRQAITVGDSTAAWTHAQLSPLHLEFLDALPMVAQDETVLLVHASVDSPELWHYVYDQRAAGLSLAAASKFPEVVRYEYQSVCPRMSGDQRVGQANRLSRAMQFSMDLTSLVAGCAGQLHAVYAGA